MSDYIVKNRGIMPGSARDAYDQYREVESIVMSTYKACTETDVEGNGRPFTAEVRADLLPFNYGSVGNFVQAHMPITRSGGEIDRPYAVEGKAKLLFLPIM